MAEQEPKSFGGGHGGLYFIVGILVAAVAVLGFLYANGNIGGNRDVNVQIETPKTDGSPKSNEAPTPRK